MQFELRKRDATLLLAALLGFSLLLRLTVGVAYSNHFDTFWYRKWAFDLPNGLFSVYARAKDITLDYPPLYLFCLYLTGLAYRLFGENCGEALQMFLLKFWPILFDLLCTVAFYRVGASFSAGTGLVAAALWAFNPSVFFNSAMWGQTDGVMALLLLLSFWYCRSGKAKTACVVFAIAGMTKFQCLFFTPVLLLELWRRTDLKRVLAGCGAAAISVAIVFLPFMIGSRAPLLFFDVYLNGGGKYPYCTLNAFNLYGLFGLNWVKESEPLIGPLPIGALGAVFTVLSFGLIVSLFLRGRRTCGFVGGLLLMQCLFLLTTRMHERYQYAVLPFALAAWIVHRERPFLRLFAALTAMTLVNQALLLFLNQKLSPFLTKTYDVWMQLFSAVNLLLFVWSVAVCVRFFLTAPPDAPDAPPAESTTPKEEPTDGILV